MADDTKYPRTVYRDDGSVYGTELEKGMIVVSTRPTPGSQSTGAMSRRADREYQQVKDAFNPDLLLSAHQKKSKTRFERLMENEIGEVPMPTYYDNLIYRIPHLIQRMNRADSPRHTGVDAKFHMDYMGSSEFECGAMQKSLKGMRGADPETFIIKRIRGSFIPENAQCNLWYVGRAREFDIAESVVYAALDPHRPFHTFKERPRMHETLVSSTGWSYDGWWALNEGHGEPDFVSFAIFTKKQYASDWRSALLSKS